MNSSSAAGTDLWKAFKQGDGESYAELMERNYRPLYSYGTKLTSDEELVTHCIQETFLELWHRRAALGTDRSPRFYLLRTLQRRIQRALLHNRVFYKSLGISLSTDFSVRFSLEADLVGYGEQRDKTQPLTTLPPRQKQLIYLRFYQDLTFDEVADLMKLNRRSAYNSLRETLSRFRDNGQDFFSTKPYHTYETTDFLLDDQFVDWVKFPTRESNVFWQQWLLKHPAQTTVVQDSRYWITNLTVNEQLPTDKATRYALEQTYAQIPDEQPPVVVSPKRRWLSFAWRAVVAVLIAVSVSWYNVSMRKMNTGSLPGIADELILRQNNFARPVSLQLPDGSQVVLAPNSQVLFPDQFAAQARELTLKGDASFDVVSQPRQPFIVHAGKVTVRAAAGTRFRVRPSGRNGDVNVSVNVGTAAVSKAAESAGDGRAVEVTTNQQVTF